MRGLILLKPRISYRYRLGSVASLLSILLVQHSIISVVSSRSFKGPIATTPTMADLSKLPKDFYVTSMQFTKNAHQDVYPAIDPSSPEHSLAGKVAVITGASRGIGAMVC